MAHITKVKPNKGYQWDQDNKNIYAKINMPGHTSIKNIQIFLSDLILRITSKQKKTSQILDLAHEIDYLCPQNRFNLVDGQVSAILRKQQINKNWQTLLEQNLPMSDIKARRQQSQAKYEKNISQIQSNKQKMKNDHDRMATRQLMRFEDEERKKLNMKKDKQKQDALNYVFSNVDEKTGKIQHQNTNKRQGMNSGNNKNSNIKEIDYDRLNWEEKGKRALQLFEKEEQQERKARAQQRKKIVQLDDPQTNQGKHKGSRQDSMFTEEDVSHFDELRHKIDEGVQIQEIPVRKQAKINVKFSDKPYANVAARDFHYNQPPMPKRSAMFPPTQGDLQNKNPLWLKDKGDGFMSDKNYEAAIHAYDQAIKIDPSQIKVIMNRSFANMKILNIDGAIHDCDSVLLYMQKQLTGNQQNSQEALHNMIKIKVRKAMCIAWKGNLKDSRLLFNQVMEFDLSQEIKQQVQSCLFRLDNRQQSLKIKLKADEKVKNQQYQQAVNIYNDSIKIDGNQYALSNKSLCLNKLNQFQESIITTQIGFNNLNQFGVNAYARISTSSSTTLTNISSLFLKLLYRKAKALQGTNNIKQAENTLRLGLEVSPEDKDFRQCLKSIKSKQMNQKIIQLKAQASSLLKQNRSKDALDIYTQCLKMLEGADNTLEYLSVMQNQCVCYLKLEQYDSIVSVSNRILKLVNNLINRLVDFDRRKGNITKQELNKIAIRTLVRRANAYLKTGRREHAKGDLQRALEIDPNDQNVAKQLSKIQQVRVI